MGGERGDFLSPLLFDLDRDAGQADRADGKGEAVRRIKGFLRKIPWAEWLALDEAIAREAARIRGVYGLRTPDAIIAATAVVGGATALVTNDREMRKVEGEGIKVFVLEDFVR